MHTTTEPACGAGPRAYRASFVDGAEKTRCSLAVMWRFPQRKAPNNVDAGDR